MSQQELKRKQEENTEEEHVIKRVKGDETDEDEDEDTHDEKTNTHKCSYCKDNYEEDDLYKCEYRVSPLCGGQLICDSCKDLIHQSWELEGEPDGTICLQCHTYTRDNLCGKLPENNRSENSEEEEDE